VAEQEATVPGRFFVYNESLDFFAAMMNIKTAEHQRFFSHLREAEVEASKRLESIAFGRL
jgi:hypothetical protein